MGVRKSEITLYLYFPYCYENENEILITYLKKSFAPLCYRNLLIINELIYFFLLKVDYTADKENGFNAVVSKFQRGP